MRSRRAEASARGGRPVADRYAAIVVGVGGAACGARLARRGLRVLVLDENSRPGPKATTVGKHRFRYEPWPIVGGPSLGSELARVLGELGPASEVRLRSTLPHARGDGRFGEVNAQDRPKRSGWTRSDVSRSAPR
jgi:phytoene dehydrogenase-like protein